MNKEELLELLDQADIRIVTDFQTIQYVEVRTSIYFRGSPGRQGWYDRFDRSSPELESRLNQIIRIEKMYNDEFYPIWTKEDGVIDINEKFVRLNGRYYTIPFLEDLINKIVDFKSINI